MELIAFVVEIILEVFKQSKNRFIKAVVFIVSGLMVLLLLSLFVLIMIHSYQNNNDLMLIITLLLTLSSFGFIIYTVIQAQRKREQTFHNIS